MENKSAKRRKQRRRKQTEVTLKVDNMVITASGKITLGDDKPITLQEVKKNG